MLRDLKKPSRDDLASSQGPQACLLLGIQIAHLILALIGLHIPKRWQAYLASQNRLCFFQLGLWVLEWLNIRMHQNLWREFILPSLFFESG